MKVLSFGEILFDIIEGQYYLGGAPLNFAAHLSKLGASTFMVSRVGEDELGNNALEQVKKLGIGTDFIGKDAHHPTGTVTVDLKDGHPDYEIHTEVAYDFIELENWDRLKSESFDILYYGTLGQRSMISSIALDRILRDHDFKYVFYDVNLRKDGYKKSIIKRSLGYCSIFKLNDEEVDILSQLLYNENNHMEQFIRRLSEDFDIETIIVTAGGEGSYVLHNSALSFVNSYPASVQDTVGAGDSFSAAFLHTYYHTGDVLKAGDKANMMGAFVASSKGAIPEYSEDIREAFEV